MASPDDIKKNNSIVDLLEQARQLNHPDISIDIPVLKVYEIQSLIALSLVEYPKSAELKHAMLEEMQASTQFTQQILTSEIDIKEWLRSRLDRVSSSPNITAGYQPRLPTKEEIALKWKKFNESCEAEKHKREERAAKLKEDPNSKVEQRHTAVVDLNGHAHIETVFGENDYIRTGENRRVRLDKVIPSDYHDGNLGIYNKEDEEEYEEEYDYC